MSFRDLKKNSDAFMAKVADFSKKQATGGFERQRDPTFWELDGDKAGNGFAIIRFLPCHDEEAAPSVQWFYYNFKGPTNKQYSERSLTTIGQVDPVNEFNKKLRGGVPWDQMSEEKKRQNGRYTRIETNVSNIYVIKDPANPENEGKVFKFRYGKKIRQKLDEKLNPVEIEGYTPERMNPYDMWKGAPFILKLRRVDKNRNYDTSEWGDKGPLADDETLEKIYNSVYKLEPLIAESEFKSYDELHAKLVDVLGYDPLAEDAPATAPAAPKAAISKTGQASIPEMDAEADIPSSLPALVGNDEEGEIDPAWLESVVNE